MKLLVSIALVFGFFLAGASLAEAHAFVDHAEPPVGGVVHGSPGTVKIWFTRKLDRALSKVQVFDANGREVERGKTDVDPGNQTLLVVPIPKLPAGHYKVTWRAVCVDAHTTRGSFTFEVTGG